MHFLALLHDLTHVLGWKLAAMLVNELLDVLTQQLLRRLVLQLGHGGCACLVVALHQKVDHRVTRHVAEARFDDVPHGFHGALSLRGSTQSVSDRRAVATEGGENGGGGEGGGGEGGGEGGGGAGGGELPLNGRAMSRPSKYTILP